MIRFSSLHCINNTLLKPTQRQALLEDARRCGVKVVAKQGDILAFETPHDSKTFDRLLRITVPSYYAINAGISRSEIPSLESREDLSTDICGATFSYGEINAFLKAQTELASTQAKPASIFVIPGYYCQIGVNTLTENLTTFVKTMLKATPTKHTLTEEQKSADTAREKDAFRELLDMPEIDTTLDALDGKPVLYHSNIKQGTYGEYLDQKFREQLEKMGTTSQWLNDLLKQLPDDPQQR